MLSMKSALVAINAHDLGVFAGRVNLFGGLFQANLLEEGSFVDAVCGCTYVMHTASPYIVYVPNGKEEELLIKPALAGTENLLSELFSESKETEVSFVQAGFCYDLVCAFTHVKLNVL